MTVLTVGHSTRSLEELTALLRHHGVDEVRDIRTAPGSRRVPHFGRAVLAEALPAAGIGYRHVKELGGLRRPLPDSQNGGWRNESFRGYADYMQTSEFAAAVDALVEEQRGRRVAIMCAEAVPWRCHRSLVADALLARGVEALEIISDAPPRPHRLTPFARVEGRRVTYPG